MSPSKATQAPAELAWLRELLGDVPGLPEQRRPRPYWSQRTASSPAEPEPWPSVVHRVRGLINEFERDHYFAEVLGYDCVDGNGESDSSVEQELGSRVGKPDLCGKDDADWSESDLCDFIEVFHDLAARPTRGWYHDFCNCGFHPTRFSRKSGQALYRWRVNRLLDGTSLDVRLAEDGEDVGRVIRVAPSGVAQLTSDAVSSSAGEDRDEVAHAVALFRARGASRHQRRSAIVALAGVLEHRRALLNPDHSCSERLVLLGWVLWFWDWSTARRRPTDLPDALRSGLPQRIREAATGCGARRSRSGSGSRAEAGFR